MAAIPAISKVEYDHRKQLVEELRNLSEDECKEIFRILRRFNVPYTENSNGVHFDLVFTSNEAVEEINKYVFLCKKQKESEEVRVKEMEGLRHESEHVSTN